MLTLGEESKQRGKELLFQRRIRRTGRETGVNNGGSKVSDR
jgi:hypothetical protein